MLILANKPQKDRFALPVVERHSVIITSQINRALLPSAAHELDNALRFPNFEIETKLIAQKGGVSSTGHSHSLGNDLQGAASYGNYGVINKRYVMQAVHITIDDDG